MLWHKAIGAGGQGGSGWDITKAVYVDSYQVPVDNVTGITFKPDGTKMYATGYSRDEVNEYNLNPPWDVSSASYSQGEYLDVRTTNPRTVKFKPDGTKMYGLSSQNRTVVEYDLGEVWNVTTASYIQNTSINDQETTPWDIAFKPDGTKMYLIGTVGADVNEYNLSTPWDISTLTYLQNFPVEAQESNPYGLFFKPDGTRMYMVGYFSTGVHEYSLSTAWDVTSATYHKYLDASAQLGITRDVAFSSDGTQLYLLSGDSYVHSYDL